MDVKTLLEKSMELEKIQAQLYEGLQKKFSFSKEISEFWSSMAEDERGHYERIRKMYKNLEDQQLSSAVSEDLYNKICKGLIQLKLERLGEIFNLDDACKLAHEVEDYETQAVFEFIEERFRHNLYRLEVANLILVHLDRLASFSEKLGPPNERKLIKASVER